ncbi:hypothetical protein H4R99_005596 [Coemansia sp. RSA 1722]|nr:hypothetical protein LPJ57_002597 [Coemansia sp. RSA 486]KAJ2226991.1 hypothetical protein IWW45_007212 [Coemansia sp. RSA 485]KAJ2594833.1 hypothetical protein H4R99_005596 [Coemansia sp. RSA 1722]KAJ2639476.1 hypothetical protein GGF40_000834 [Coemansia sp. RSA 1286]
MVFGWHRSSSKRPKGTKLVRASSIAQQTPTPSASASISDMHSGYHGTVGRHASLPTRTNAPTTPQFPPTYQPSPAASVSSFYSKGTVLSAPCSAGSSPRNAGVSTPQRRPCSVMVAGLEALPEDRMHELYAPRSAASVHGGYAGPRRCSNGSAVSASSTLAPAHNSCFFAPPASPAVDPHIEGTQHAPAAYYYAQPQSPAAWNEPIAGNDTSLYYTEPVDQPAAGSGNIVETRRASVGTVYYEYSSNVTHYPAAGYYVVSPSTPTAVGQQRPVSYVYRAHSDYASTVASPISPVSQEYYHYQAEAPRYPVRQIHTQHHQGAGLHDAIPSFYANGNAAEAPPNYELGVNCQVAAAPVPATTTKSGYAYRTLPALPLKPGYYALRNSTHFAYVPLSQALPPTPEGGMAENIFSEEQQQLLQPHSEHAPGSSAPLSVTIPAAEKYSDVYGNASTDNSQHAPDVDTAGVQYAYLPPRSTNLTITN